MEPANVKVDPRDHSSSWETAELMEILLKGGAPVRHMPKTDYAQLTRAKEVGVTVPLVVSAEALKQSARYS